MFGLTGIWLKLAIAGIIVTVITATIGGFWLYQKSIVNDLNKQIAAKQKIIDEQKVKIAGLILDKEKLTVSNKSLEGEIARKSEETKAVFAEIERLRKKDIESSARIQSIQRVLRDKSRLERVESVRSTKKASLLIKLMDKNIKCYAENFEKVDGRCIRGTWVPNGERLIPKAPETPTSKKEGDTAQ